MATHSSVLAWRIPWTEEPGRLQWVGDIVLLSLHLCPLKVNIHREGHQDPESSLPGVVLLTGQEGLVPRPEVFPLHLSAVELSSSLTLRVISVSH